MPVSYMAELEADLLLRCAEMRSDAERLLQHLAAGAVRDPMARASLRSLAESILYAVDEYERATDEKNPPDGTPVGETGK